MIKALDFLLTTYDLRLKKSMITALDFLLTTYD